jgi:hypothetical protein
MTSPSVVTFVPAATAHQFLNLLTQVKAILRKTVSRRVCPCIRQPPETSYQISRSLSWILFLDSCIVFLYGVLSVERVDL